MLPRGSLGLEGTRALSLSDKVWAFRVGVIGGRSRGTQFSEAFDTSLPSCKLPCNVNLYLDTTWYCKSVEIWQSLSLNVNRPCRDSSPNRLEDMFTVRG